MKRVMVFGAGRVGRVIARDLESSGEIEVTVADRRASYLDNVGEDIGVATMTADLANANAVADVVSDFDLVVDALPGALGHTALKGVIEAGKNCVDVSFMPEDPRGLEERAREKGVVVLYDFGVAPGMSNLLAAKEVVRLKPARHVSIMVGGLPRKRTHPWEYTAPVSPEDIIEEYVRPARMRVNGEIMIRPALTGLEYLDVPGIGTLEAFHSDGLRSLLDTLDCPNIEEKTLRYPGHRDRIKLLSESGFFDLTPIEVEGIKVAPRQIALRLLESAWKPDEDSGEFTVMRIAVIGGKGPECVKTIWNLFDNSDRDRNETSMSRTTGFPAAIAARMMLDRTMPLKPGVHPPEALAYDAECIAHILSELDRRGVHYQCENDLKIYLSTIPPPPM